MAEDSKCVFQPLASHLRNISRVSCISRQLELTKPLFADFCLLFFSRQTFPVDSGRNFIRAPECENWEFRLHFYAKILIFGQMTAEIEAQTFQKTPILGDFWPISVIFGHFW